MKVLILNGHLCTLPVTIERVHGRACACTRSYGARTETSGTVQVSFDAEAVKGRHCLMVDDLCDSGLTLLTVSSPLAATAAGHCAGGGHCAEFAARR